MVHSHTFPANMVARLMRLIGVAPVVLSTIHNIYEGGWHRTLAYRITDSFSRHTTAVSDAVARRCVQGGALPARKCSVIHNGFDVRRFSPRNLHTPSFENLPPRKPGFLWLAAGRIVPAKDYVNLLRAFASLSIQAPENQLWIAGAGPEKEAKALQKLAVQLRIEDRVHWLGAQKDMMHLFGTADGFVLSSAWEGMPLVVGEAMAMEIPVVATDVGGVRELLGATGTIVPPLDPQALAEAMLRLMQTPLAQRQAMGSQARERIQLHFNIDAKVDQWQSLYADLLSSRNQLRTTKARAGAIAPARCISTSSQLEREHSLEENAP
jgi:glycosyltransferase involved in cell wall biosynthesis